MQNISSYYNIKIQKTLFNFLVYIMYFNLVKQKRFIGFFNF